MSRAALWDMDGTLVDTAELHFQAWLETCLELGRSFDRDDFAATFGRRNPEIVAHLFGDRFTSSETDQIGDRKEILYREAARKQGVQLLPGVANLLQALKEAGFLQGIGSSAPHANLELILDLTGIRDCFGAVVGAEDTTRGKPDPQVFLLGAERLGAVPSRCVVFEDAPAGIQAARAGGMRSVAVAFVGHHPEVVLRSSGADLIVHSLADITVEKVAELVG